MAELIAKGLVKSYKGRTVVNGVELTVKTGEIVGLLGPNGAGKTTSFYMVVGLVKQDEGSISVDGEEFEFSGGFTDLHTESYKSILNHNGFGMEDARNSIEIAHLIRNQEILINPNESHPFLKK